MLVRWYLAYSLSYRDVEELALERGLKVDHATGVLQDSWHLFLNFLFVFSASYCPQGPQPHPSQSKLSKSVDLWANGLY